MASAVAIDPLAREGQDHSGGHDPVGLHQHGPIVERRVGGKQVEQQVHGQLGIEINAGVEKILGPQITAQVHHDQAAAAGLGKAPGGLAEYGH